MTFEQRPTNRFMTLGLPRVTTKADAGEVVIPIVQPAKAPAIEWQPPKVAIAEDLPTDATERYLAEPFAARFRALRAKVR